MLEEADGGASRTKIITSSLPFAPAAEADLLLRQIRPAELYAVPRSDDPQHAYAAAFCPRDVEFLSWCSLHGVTSLGDVQPLHAATWIEQMSREASAPAVKQRLAAVRHLFDWLVTGQIWRCNRPLRYAALRIMLRAARRECSTREAIDLSTPIGLRDRALIGLMVYSFDHFGARSPCGSRTCFYRTGAFGCDSTRSWQAA